MNEETAENNHYQQALAGVTPEEIRDRALEEFEGLVDLLERHGVQVLVWDEMPDSDTPDSLFPNNWFSTHADGVFIHYPMYAENRRQERREDIAVDLEHLHGFEIKDILDFTEFEEHDKFLEGTGSMVLDRAHGKSYAALSERTDRGALAHYCSAMDVEGIVFEAFQTVKDMRLPIYHTNVMMSIGSGFAAICLDCIDDLDERSMVLETLAADNLEVIALTEEQIGSFAGNML
ncbi:MAG: arginine deiminase-related protein, partial [Flavobacteriales bacterium]|nr:arginine deiminase-related protein [Flavobacteriales bacterium]